MWKRPGGRHLSSDAPRSNVEKKLIEWSISRPTYEDVTSCRNADVLIETIAALPDHTNAAHSEDSHDLEDQVFIPERAIRLVLEDFDQRCFNLVYCMRLFLRPS